MSLTVVGGNYADNDSGCVAVEVKSWGLTAASRPPKSSYRGCVRRCLYSIK